MTSNKLLKRLCHLEHEYNDMGQYAIGDALHFLIVELLPKRRLELYQLVVAHPLDTAAYYSEAMHPKQAWWYTLAELRELAKLELLECNVFLDQTDHKTTWRARRVDFTGPASELPEWLRKHARA